jgi:hypothetical protein
MRLQRESNGEERHLSAQGTELAKSLISAQDYLRVIRAPV